MKWTPQDVAAARQPRNPSLRLPKALAAQGPPAPSFGEAGGPRTYLVGPYAVALGGRLFSEQLPDRTRIVLTGPVAEGLAQAIVAAVEVFLARAATGTPERPT